MPTPQTNTTLPEIAAALLECDSFAICGHVSPDGDCLGSQSGLALALRSLGKTVTCLLAEDEPVEQNLRFLPGIGDFIVGSDFDGEVDAFITVDVPSLSRMGTAAALHQRTKRTITIDHHASETTMSQLNFVEPDAAACACIIWDLVKILGAVDESVATCLYTGTVTDTGRFQFQNTTPETFRIAAEMVDAGADLVGVSREVFQNRTLPSMALESLVIERMTITCNGMFSFSRLSLADFEACNAVKADAEPLIDTLRSVSGIRVACILREKKPGEIRGSFRAKDDTDVSAIARKFDGGGHKAAAGFTIHGTLDEAEQLVRAAVAEVLGSEEVA